MPTSRSNRPVLAVTCLMLGFALARLMLGEVEGLLAAGPPAVAQLDETRDCCRAASDRIDTVFVGSSLTWRHVDPGAVAVGADSRGVTLRPYTLGVQGMTAFEQARLIDELLASPPPALRALVVEARPVALVGWENAYTDRALLGATWDEMRAAVGFHLASDERLGKRLDRALPFAAGWLARSTGTGSLSRLLVPPEESLDVPEAARGCDHDGFWPLEWSTEPDVLARREAFLADDRGISTETDPPERPDAVWISHYRSLVQRVRDAGLTCVIYVPPSLLQLEELRGLVMVADEAFADAPVVSFLPEDRGAGLYAREVRFDREHLLLPAARGVSRALGAAVADALRAEGR